MATFRQRKDSWRVEVSVKGVRDSGTFDTKTQAKAWAAKRETELRDQANGKLPSFTLQNAIDRYVREVSINKKAHYKEIARIKVFCKSYPNLCKKQISKITTDDLVQWRDSRLKEVQGATVRREATILSGIFTVAKKEWKWIHESPLTDLSMPPIAKSRDRRVTQDEIDRLCLAAMWDESTPTTSTQQTIIAFLLALETAMRAGEILTLTWDRVFLEERYVALDETKNGTKRNVPLSKRAVELIVHLKPLDKTMVFTCKRSSFSALWIDLKKKCKIEDLHFHDSRHEACTRLARKLDVLDLARMIGHKDLKSLMVYYNATATEIAHRLD